MRVLLNELHLVYIPFTNQEGVWFSKDPEVREYVKESKLYMIAHREELKFVNLEFLPVLNGWVKFQLQMGETLSPFIFLPLSDALRHLADDKELQMELGDKGIRIREEENPGNVILWYTPDKFLFDYWRGNIAVQVEGEFNHREFTRYELYYVGISKKNDSLTRLFDEAHHARVNILSNEGSKTFGARLTDELVIFLFDIERLNINVLHNVDEVEKDMNYQTSDKIAVFADAEKAFVKLLDTKYNEVKYKNFPLSSDGLYHEGLARYSFSIAEDITFVTQNTEFKGARDGREKRDFIFIEGDTANIVRE